MIQKYIRCILGKKEDKFKYKEGEQLKIKLYETDYSGVPLTTYYEFSSIDNGVSWEYEQTHHLKY